MVSLEKANYRAVRIEGISHQGFLKTRDVESGTVYEVQPDGNSFDALKGLITIKR